MGKFEKKQNVTEDFKAFERFYGWLAGRYDNPMPTWFLAPIAGLKGTVLRDRFRKC
jgi:hypothetical protein